MASATWTARSTRFSSPRSATNGDSPCSRSCWWRRTRAPAWCSGRRRGAGRPRHWTKERTEASRRRRTAARRRKKKPSRCVAGLPGTWRGAPRGRASTPPIRWANARCRSQSRRCRRRSWKSCLGSCERTRSRSRTPPSRASTERSRDSPRPRRSRRVPSAPCPWVARASPCPARWRARWRYRSVRTGRPYSRDVSN